MLIPWPGGGPMENSTMPKAKRTGKVALIDFRKRVYRISPAGLHAIMELTSRRVDRDDAVRFILRQEGYELLPARE